MNSKSYERRHVPSLTSLLQIRSSKKLQAPSQPPITLRPGRTWGGMRHGDALALFAFLLKILAASFLPAISPALVQGKEWRPRQVGRWVVSDQVMRVAARDGYAWCASGRAGLQIFDLQQHGNVVPVGRWKAPGGVRAVALAEHSLVASDGFNRLWVLDVSKPRKPEPLGSCPGPESDGDLGETALISDLAVCGNLVYATTGGSLCIFDINRPQDPELVECLQLKKNVDRLFLTGSTLVMSGYGSVQIADVTMSCSPKIVATINLGTTWVKDICLTENRLFIAADSTGMLIYDLADPSQFKFLGTFRGRGTNTYFNSVLVQNGIAWLGTYGNGLYTVDVHNPASPEQVGWLPVWGELQHIVFDGQTACIAGGGNGLNWIDISNPFAPVARGEYDSSEHVCRLLIHDGVLVVLNGMLGFDLFNLADPRRPRPLARIEPGGNVQDAALFGRYIALATGSGGLLVVDLADPEKPVRASRLRIADEVVGIRRLNDTTALAIVVCAAGNSGIWVIDLTRPHAPQVKGKLPIGQISDLWVKGALAYVALGSDCLVVVDLSRHNQPREAARISLNNEIYVHQVTGDGSTLFFCGLGTIQSWSLANPLRPAMISQQQLKTNDGQLEGELLLDSGGCYIADDLQLCRIDISEPAKLRIEGCVKTDITNINRRNMVKNGSYLYIASWGMISIFELAH